jgi:hypothetical protein
MLSTKFLVASNNKKSIIPTLQIPCEQITLQTYYIDIFSKKSSIFSTKQFQHHIATYILGGTQRQSQDLHYLEENQVVVEAALHFDELLRPSAQP